MNEQLAIPMPVVGVQVTVRLDNHGHWVVESRVLRQDQGWQMVGRWTEGSRDRAELVAADALGLAWAAEPLD